MVETAYSRAMAQRDVEIAGLKHELAEAQEVVNRHETALLAHRRVLDSYRTILMTLSQKLDVLTEILELPDLPVGSM